MLFGMSKLAKKLPNKLGTKKPVALPKRPMIVVPPDASTWGSCISITPNLISAYLPLLGATAQTVSFGRRSTPMETLHAAQKIAAYSPSHLIFVDHERHPHDLLVALHMFYKLRKFPQLIFHVYGDFTLFTQNWLKSESLLKQKEIKFISASPRQKALIGSFVKKPDQLTDVCHFPVSSEEFSFISVLRRQAREKYKIDKSEFTLIYTGRISLQKNILSLIFHASQKMESLGANYRIILAGAFDDMGSPLFGLRQRGGDYFRGFQRFLENMPEQRRSKIHYIGHLGKQELRELYHAADLFLSFSTHHDEDYGMSPIEALMCGTKTLISDWGGYAGFALNKGGSGDHACRLLPVKLANESGARVLLEKFHPSLSSIYSEWIQETDALRDQRAALYAQHFNIQAATDKIRHALAKPATKFAGFTENLRLHAKLSKAMMSRGFMFAPKKSPDTNYRKFYKYYSSDLTK
jgi:glycosyltransferase involved in cell wall biosynthesis